MSENLLVISKGNDSNWYRKVKFRIMEAYYNHNNNSQH